MELQDNTPDATLNALKIKLADIEKKLNPAEAECDNLRYQRDTLLATIALISRDSPSAKSVTFECSRTHIS